MAHYLAIADVYVVVQVAARAASLHLVWHNEVMASYPYELPTGEKRRIDPDAVFVLGGAGVETTMVYLEVDRASESLQQ